MIGFILFLLVIGLIAGFLARLLVPGADPMTVGQTLLLGIVGSFVRGFLGYLLFQAAEDGEDGAFQASGPIGSVVGAVIVLLVYHAPCRVAVGHPPLTQPAPPRGRRVPAPRATSRTGLETRSGSNGPGSPTCVTAGPPLHCRRGEGTLCG